MSGEVNEANDALVKSYMMKMGAGDWQCSECGFRKVGRDSLNGLVEANHVNVTFICVLCEKECKSRNSLLLHRSRYHKNMY